MRGVGRTPKQLQTICTTYYEGTILKDNDSGKTCRRLLFEHLMIQEFHVHGVQFHFHHLSDCDKSLFQCKN